LWFHEIHDNGLDFYALAPFSTMKPEHTMYSEDARAAAKHGQGHPDFWIGAIVSTLYFSGVCHSVNFICTYPGHRAGSGNAVMNESMDILGKCFRAKYLPDMILRHTTAIKSQGARNSGTPIDHLNQLNTICLNKTPAKGPGTTYKHSPLTVGKTVLLIDDICTRGYSLESARAYIEQTGAKVIMAAWLKTINTDISALDPLNKFDPYLENTFTTVSNSKSYPYHGHIVDRLAPAELTNQFSHYQNWDWPS
jgi:hypothetical protein